RGGLGRVGVACEVGVGCSACRRTRLNRLRGGPPGLRVEVAARQHLGLLVLRGTGGGTGSAGRTGTSAGARGSGRGGGVGEALAALGGTGHRAGAGAVAHAVRRGVAQGGGAVEGLGFGVAGVVARVVARVVVRAEQARFLRRGHGGGTLGTIGGVGGDVGIGAVVGETTVGRDVQIVVQA